MRCGKRGFFASYSSGKAKHDGDEIMSKYMGFITLLTSAETQCTRHRKKKDIVSAMW